MSSTDFNQEHLGVSKLIHIVLNCCIYDNQLSLGRHLTRTVCRSKKDNEIKESKEAVNALLEVTQIIGQCIFKISIRQRQLIFFCCMGPNEPNFRKIIIILKSLKLLKIILKSSSDKFQRSLYNYHAYFGRIEYQFSFRFVL